jgi:hypothetical protein
MAQLRARRYQIFCGSSGFVVGKFMGRCRVGHRRAMAKPHVSCAPSSNRTCRFPASGSPIIFFRRRAPQSFQMAHLPNHAIKSTSFVKEAVLPSFLGGPPWAMMLAPEPQLQFAPNCPVYLTECPVTVPNPKICTPAIQDWVQFLDHCADLPI